MSEFIWLKHSRNIRISRRSKEWWNTDYQSILRLYQSSKSLENWKVFKETVKKFKQMFIDNKIDEIASKNCRLWNLMNWVKKCKLLAPEALSCFSQYYKVIHVICQYSFI